MVNLMLCVFKLQLEKRVVDISNYDIYTVSKAVCVCVCGKKFIFLSIYMYGYRTILGQLSLAFLNELSSD